MQTAEPLADKLKIKIITTDLLLETKRGNLENARKTPEIRTQVTNALF